MGWGWEGKRKGKAKREGGLEGSELVRRGDSVYVWDGDGDKRRKIKCVPILLSRVEREKRRAKKSLVGGRARMEVEGESVARATAPSLPLPETLE